MSEGPRVKQVANDNFTATTDPGVGNDSSQGYGVLSHWLNKTAGTVWACVDSTVGAAIWKNLTAAAAASLKNNFTATTDPGVGNDGTQGYAIGSRWVNTTTKTDFTCVNITTGAAVWLIDGNGSGGPLGSSQVVNATLDDVTTSVLDVVAGGMTITPVAGTYQVWFSGSMENSGGATFMFASVWSGGAQVGASERRQKLSSGQVVPFATQAQVTVNGSQAIEGRWRTAANVGTMHQRSLLIERLN